MSLREVLASPRKYLAAAAFALVAGIGTSPAYAVPVSVGSTITVSYDRPVFFLLPDLTATIALTVESMTNNQIVLGVDVDNTTSPWFLTSRLSNISFSTGVSPTGASDTSTAYNVSVSPTTVALNGSGGFWHSSSLRPTQGELFTLTLVGNFSGSTIDLSNFTAKFQSLIGSFTAQGTIDGVTAGTGTGPGSVTTPSGGAGGSSVPEPSTISLLAVALLGVLTYRALSQRKLQRVPVRVRNRDQVR
jgi:hypothetical protein